MKHFVQTKFMYVHTYTGSGMWAGNMLRSLEKDSMYSLIFKDPDLRKDLNLFVSVVPYSLEYLQYFI